MNKLKYTTEITLYNSYFDKNNNLTPKSILSIFQDVASIHAEEIGVGYEAMLNKNIYWVLSRIKFDIISMPSLNQKVVVETWPHEKGRIDFDRDMTIKSTDGKTLIIATSKWCVIDTISRMLKRTDDINYSGECILDKNYEDKFVKISLPDTTFKNKFDHIVRFCDLDHNGHMNNTNYANLVTSCIENQLFTHFEINFTHECMQDDVINLAHTKTESGEYVVGKVNDNVAFITYTK